MELHIASREKVKIKIALQGPSGCGKTYSALLIAFGLVGDWNKIAVIDTENHSSELYAHLGRFKVLSLESPFTPERYIEAMQLCERRKAEVIILDSLSHEWEGTGGILESQGKLMGNSYTNWNKITPRHNAFVNYMLQSPTHMIGTIRAKQDYVLTDKGGKVVPEKVGLKGITREGLDYEFTVVLEMDMKQNCSASKDRTSLFMRQPEFMVSVETGMAIKDWCNQSTDPIRLPSDEEILLRVNGCKSLDELLDLYNLYPEKQQELTADFTKKRQQLLLLTPASNNTTHHQNHLNNANTTNKQ